MSCRTGPVERADVERVLAAMGWCPNHPDDSPCLLGRGADLVARLPAVQTAAIILVVNLIFEYRDWKGAKAIIDWSVAEEPA